MPNTKKTSFKAFLNFLDNNFAIIIIIIAVFIFGFSFGSMWKGNQLAKQGVNKTAEQPADEVVAPPQQAPEKVSPVSEADHIYGASNPKVTVIEYSDFGCPFSGRVHPTLKQLVNTYPDEVAWVYRHYLLGGPTSLTGVAAQMSECIAQNNGNDKFWQFANKIYERSEANDRVADEAGFYAIATSLGVGEAGLKSCVESGLGTEVIETHASGAKDVGIGGTPALVVVSSDGEFEFVAGAVPFESLEETVKKYF
jgi:protein-disulfide isomerase